MRRHVILLSELALVWYLLSGHYSLLLLSLGAASCLVCYAVYLQIARHTTHHRLKFNPVHQLRYLAWLMKEIVKANLAVMAAIINPRKISPQIFVVKTGELDKQGRVVYANSITRTPGTVSVTVSDYDIEVHTLLQQSRQDLEGGSMLARIETLQQHQRGD
jgi:multicomponent Na+:H+ antiporter subunit E